MIMINVLQTHLTLPGQTWYTTARWWPELTEVCWELVRKEVADANCHWVGRRKIALKLFATKKKLDVIFDILINIWLDSFNLQSFAVFSKLIIFVRTFEMNKIYEYSRFMVELFCKKWFYVSTNLISETIWIYT